MARGDTPRRRTRGKPVRLRTRAPHYVCSWGNSLRWGRFCSRAIALDDAWHDHSNRFARTWLAIDRRNAGRTA